MPDQKENKRAKDREEKSFDKAQDRENGFGKFSWKEIPLLIITGGVLVFGGYLFKQLFLEMAEKDLVVYVLPGVAMVVFVILFSIVAMLVSSRWVSFIFFLLMSLGAVSFIPPWQASYVAATLIFFVLLYAFHAIRSSYLDSATFHAASAIKHGLSATFTAVILLASFYYLQAQIVRPPEIVPTGLIDRITESVSSFTEEKFQDGLGVVEQQAEQKLEEQGIPVKKILSTIKGFLQNAQDKNGVEQLSSAVIGLKDSSQEKLSSAIRTRIENIIEPYRPFIPYVFTLLFFFVLKGITFILYWITIPLALITLKFLVTIGIVQRKKVPIEVERVFF